MLNLEIGKAGQSFAVGKTITGRVLLQVTDGKHFDQARICLKPSEALRIAEYLIIDAAKINFQLVEKWSEVGFEENLKNNIYGGK